MPDLVDQSNDAQEVILDAAIRRVCDNLVIPENTTGKCLTCGSKVSDSRRWCDADCRDLYAAGET